MIEIKFRAWDDSEKVMYDNIQNGNVFDAFLHSGNYEVMQFTGLKDLKGVEIYEGDLVEVETKEIFIVAWYDRGACFRYMDFKKNGDFIDSNSPLNYDEVKIIGNIYENPELLK